MITQLDPPLYLVTPLGPGVSHVLWTHYDEVWWQVFQERTGESWWWPNHEVRLTKNLTDGRHETSPIVLSPERRSALAPHLERYG